MAPTADRLRDLIGRKSKEISPVQRRTIREGFGGLDKDRSPS